MDVFFIPRRPYTLPDPLPAIRADSPYSTEEFHRLHSEVLGQLYQELRYVGWLEKLEEHLPLAGALLNRSPFGVGDAAMWAALVGVFAATTFGMFRWWLAPAGLVAMVAVSAATVASARRNGAARTEWALTNLAYAAAAAGCRRVALPGTFDELVDSLRPFATAQPADAIWLGHLIRTRRARRHLNP